MNREPLDQSALKQALDSLQDWEYQNDRLSKTFKFSDFHESVAFIVRIAFHADELDHHPILYNVYNQVRVELTTHSAGNKVTQMDVLLARAIDKVMGGQN